MGTGKKKVVKPTPRLPPALPGTDKVEFAASQTSKKGASRSSVTSKDVTLNIRPSRLAERTAEGRGQSTGKSSRVWDESSIAPASRIFGDLVAGLGRLTPPPNVSTAGERAYAVTSMEIVSESSTALPKTDQPNFRISRTSSHSQSLPTILCTGTHDWTKMHPLNAQDALLRPLVSNALTTLTETESLFLPAGVDKIWYLGSVEQWSNFQKQAIDFWKSQSINTRSSYVTYTDMSTHLRSTFQECIRRDQRTSNQATAHAFPRHHIR